MGMPFTTRPARLAPGTKSQRIEWIAEPELEYVTLSLLFALITSLPHKYLYQSISAPYK